jgi:purine-binding chemotaxis protein CheW
MQESVGQELISFRIGEQEFCVDIMAVREIRGWTQATPLPQLARAMCGASSTCAARCCRSSTWPRGLGLGRERSLPCGNVIIVVPMSVHRLVGLLVDAVSDIVQLSATAGMIQPTPDVASDAGEDPSSRASSPSRAAAWSRWIDARQRILPEQRGRGRVSDRSRHGQAEAARRRRVRRSRPRTSVAVAEDPATLTSGHSLALTRRQGGAGLFAPGQAAARCSGCAPSATTVALVQIDQGVEERGRAPGDDGGPDHQRHPLLPRAAPLRSPDRDKVLTPSWPTK